MTILKIRNTIILILLSLTPIFNIGEVSSLIRGDMRGATWFTTPIYIKLIKDSGFIVIIALSIFIFLKTNKKIRNAVIVFLAVLSGFTALLFFISYKNNPIQALAGLRWIMPLFMTALLVGTIDDKLMTQAAKIIVVVFLISMSVQLYELIRLKPWPGPYVNLRMLLKYIASNAWLGGVFILRNTAGFFACVTMFLTYFYMKRCALRLTTLTLIPVSLLIATSGTGIPVYILSDYLILAKGKFTLITVPIFFITALLIILPLSFLRGDDVTKSGSVLFRTQCFRDAIKEAGPISSQFGRGTNAAVLYSQKFKTQNTGLVLDSTITAIVANMGVLGLFFAAILYIIWVTFVLISKRLDTMIFTFIYSVFSITAPITEAFPMNLIFAICVAYFIPILLLKYKNRTDYCN